ncbi:MAG: type I methionyl aminopeptidase [Clostridia bacterium]
MITIKSKSELSIMRKAGSILRDVLNLIQDNAKPGVTTRRLDAIAYDYIKKQNAIPSFLGYGGFPATICTSIDSEIVHGIPGHKVLEEGMLLKIDGGVGLNGLHTDAARTFPIGKVSPEKLRLMQVCEESFFAGAAMLKDGVRTGDLGHTIQSYVEQNGFSVVRELVGHGIGASVHEDPSIPNYGVQGRGVRFKENMTIAVEPMINMGTRYVRTLSDNWTIVTADGMPSAHYENTIIILKGKAEIITL